MSVRIISAAAQAGASGFCGAFCVKQRILVACVLIGVLFVSGIVTNSVLEAIFSSGPTRAETLARADGNAALLHTIVAAELLHPGVIRKQVAEKPIRQEAASWTAYEYTMHVKRRGVFSEIAYALSEAIPANGGRIFQTHFQAEGHTGTIALGLNTRITHTCSFTWDPLPQETPAPVQDEPSQPSQQQQDTRTGRYAAAIVIDDLGTSEYAVQRLLDMGVDFTFSILPNVEKSSSIAAWLHDGQHEILMHLPMEPQGYEYPGQGAILMNMTAAAIQRTIHDNLRTVPFAVGVNNHMGSRLTTSAEKMQVVLRTLQQQNLFFLDSRTTGRSVAYETARRLGLPGAERAVFLDSIPGYDFAVSQLQELASLAEQGQPAIAIGHPKEATFKALEAMLPEFKRRHIDIVRLSQFVK